MIKLLIFSLIITGTYLLASHLIPVSFIERIALWIKVTEEKGRNFFLDLVIFTKDLHNKPYFKKPLEKVITSIALVTGLVTIGYFSKLLTAISPWIKNEIHHAEIIIGVAIFASFVFSLYFWVDVFVKKKAFKYEQVLGRIPFLLLGTLPVVIVFVVMIVLGFFLAVFLPLFILMPIHFVLLGQIKLARWSSSQGPERLIGWFGLLLVAIGTVIWLYL